MKFYEFFINEALKLKDAKKYTKAWKEEWNKKDSKIKEFYDKIFEKSYDRNKTRLLLDGKINSDGAEINVPKELETFVKSKGYEISNYGKGLVKKGNTQVRIGKILKDAPVDVQKVYMNDKGRSGIKKSGLRVVVSRNPLDVAGMSTDRGWTSCMNLVDGIKKHVLIDDVKVGTLVAYLIDEKDLNIKNPTARVGIKPFMNNESEILFMMEEGCYGTISEGIKKQFFEIIDGFLREINNKDIVGIFELLSPHRDSLPYKITKIGKLKEGQIWKGDLTIDELINEDLILPDNLTITGNLIVFCDKITKLPNNLHVNGDLYLTSGKIKMLPNGLKVGNNIELGHSSIEELPNNLHVNGDLNLHNTRIKELPKGLIVNKNLYLSENPIITNLPDDLQVNGNLYLTKTNIVELPKNIKIGKNLFLRGCKKIKKLPDNLIINGSLDLTSTRIKELPKGLIVNGTLLLTYSSIKTLPDDLIINGDLNLIKSKVVDVPDSVKIKGKILRY